MATGDETCDTNPNFAVICSFMLKFGNDCGVNIPITDLQHMLEDSKNVSEELKDIHIHLLRKGRKRVTKEKWERALIKFCHEYSSVDAWELERFGYKKAKLSVKLEILKRLVELQFDSNAKFKAELNKQQASTLRVLPIGRDIDGNRYWYQLDHECNMRLYKQNTEDENAWQLLCSTKEDLENLLSVLENKSTKPKEESGDPLKEEKQEAKSPVLKKDSSLLDVPTESEDLKATLSETKPYTIIIKTEKKEVLSSVESIKRDNVCEPTKDLYSKSSVPVKNEFSEKSESELCTSDVIQLSPKESTDVEMKNVETLSKHSSEPQRRNSTNKMDIDDSAISNLNETVDKCSDVKMEVSAVEESNISDVKDIVKTNNIINFDNRGVNKSVPEIVFEKHNTSSDKPMHVESAPASNELQESSQLLKSRNIHTVNQSFSASAVESSKSLKNNKGIELSECDKRNLNVPAVETDFYHSPTKGSKRKLYQKWSSEKHSPSQPFISDSDHALKIMSKETSGASDLSISKVRGHISGNKPEMTKLASNSLCSEVPMDLSTSSRTKLAENEFTKHKMKDDISSVHHIRQPTNVDFVKSPKKLSVNQVPAIHSEISAGSVVSAVGDIKSGIAADHLSRPFKKKHHFLEDKIHASDVQECNRQSVIREIKSNKLVTKVEEISPFSTIQTASSACYSNERKGSLNSLNSGSTISSSDASKIKSESATISPSDVCDSVLKSHAIVNTEKIRTIPSSATFHSVEKILSKCSPPKVENSYHDTLKKVNLSTDALNTANLNIETKFSISNTDHVPTDFQPDAKINGELNHRSHVNISSDHCAKKLDEKDTELSVASVAICQSQSKNVDCQSTGASCQAESVTEKSASLIHDGTENSYTKNDISSVKVIPSHALESSIIGKTAINKSSEHIKQPVSCDSVTKTDSKVALPESINEKVKQNETTNIHVSDLESTKNKFSEEMLCKKDSSKVQQGNHLEIDTSRVEGSSLKRDEKKVQHDSEISVSDSTVQSKLKEEVKCDTDSLCAGTFDSHNAVKLTSNSPVLKGNVVTDSKHKSSQDLSSGVNNVFNFEKEVSIKKSTKDTEPEKCDIQDNIGLPVEAIAANSQSNNEKELSEVRNELKNAFSAKTEQTECTNKIDQKNQNVVQAQVDSKLESPEEERSSLHTKSTGQQRKNFTDDILKNEDLKSAASENIMLNTCKSSPLTAEICDNSTKIIPSNSKVRDPPSLHDKEIGLGSCVKDNAKTCEDSKIVEKETNKANCDSEEVSDKCKISPLEVPHVNKTEEIKNVSLPSMKDNKSPSPEKRESNKLEHQKSEIEQAIKNKNENCEKPATFLSTPNDKESDLKQGMKEIKKTCEELLTVKNNVPFIHTEQNKSLNSLQNDSELQVQVLETVEFVQSCIEKEFKSNSVMYKELTEGNSSNNACLEKSVTSESAEKKLSHVDSENATHKSETLHSTDAVLVENEEKTLNLKVQDAEQVNCNNLLSDKSDKCKEELVENNLLKSASCSLEIKSECEPKNDCDTVLDKPSKKCSPVSEKIKPLHEQISKPVKDGVKVNSCEANESENACSQFVSVLADKNTQKCTEAETTSCDSVEDTKQSAFVSEQSNVKTKTSNIAVVSEEDDKKEDAVTTHSTVSGGTSQKSIQKTKTPKSRKKSVDAVKAEHRTETSVKADITKKDVEKVDIGSEINKKTEKGAAKTARCKSSNSSVSGNNCVVYSKDSSDEIENSDAKNRLGCKNVDNKSASKNDTSLLESKISKASEVKTKCDVEKCKGISKISCDGEGKKLGKNVEQVVDEGKTNEETVANDTLVSKDKVEETKLTCQESKIESTESDSLNKMEFSEGKVVDGAEKCDILEKATDYINEKNGEISNCAPVLSPPHFPAAFESSKMDKVILSCKDEIGVCCSKLCKTHLFLHSLCLETKLRNHSFGTVDNNSTFKARNYSFLGLKLVTNSSKEEEKPSIASDAADNIKEEAESEESTCVRRTRNRTRSLVIEKKENCASKSEVTKDDDVLFEQEVKKAPGVCEDIVIEKKIKKVTDDHEDVGKKKKAPCVQQDVVIEKEIKKAQNIQQDVVIEKEIKKAPGAAADIVIEQEIKKVPVARRRRCRPIFTGRRRRPRGAATRKIVNLDKSPDFTIPEGFLEIIGDSVKSDVKSFSKKNIAIDEKQKSIPLRRKSSKGSSENDSLKRSSRRIQAQHQKKMSELAVEMEKEHRRLEQLAKKTATQNAKVTKVQPKEVKPKTPVKAAFQPPVVEDACLDSTKRSMRKRVGRPLNMAKLTLMYDDESKDSEYSTSREMSEKSTRRRRRGRGRRPGYKPWDVSSESSESSIEEFSVEEEEEERLVFNVNEDEFACEEIEEDAEPVIVRRARTAKKVPEDGTEEVITDDKPCCKCGKHDRPEWILLCDKCDNGYHTTCLIPPLMAIPDGDWYCQPCEHLFLCQCLHDELVNFEKLLKQKEREELRKQRLAYVGISLDNVLKPEKKEEEEEEEEESSKTSSSSESSEDAKKRKEKKTHHHHHKQLSDDDTVFGKRSVRARRNVNYQFKEFDELIASAIQDEIIVKKLGEVYREEAKEKEKDKEDDSGESFQAPPPVKRKRRSHKLNDLDFTEDEDDSGDDYKGLSTDTEHTPSVNSDEYRPESDAASGEWRIVKPRSNRRSKKGRSKKYDDYQSDESYRPTTRRAAQKAVSYREISSDEEWGEVEEKKKRRKRKKKVSSSEESDASFKTRSVKKSRVSRISKKWEDSDSEPEKSSSESEESESSKESAGEWKIEKKINEGGRIKININKKVLDSESDASSKKLHRKKRANRLVSDDSNEDENDDEEEDDDDDDEEQESSESEENSDDESSRDEKSKKIVQSSKVEHGKEKNSLGASSQVKKNEIGINREKKPVTVGNDKKRVINEKQNIISSEKKVILANRDKILASQATKGVIGSVDGHKKITDSCIKVVSRVNVPYGRVVAVAVAPGTVAGSPAAISVNRDKGTSSQVVVKTVVKPVKEIKMVPSKIAYKEPETNEQEIKSSVQSTRPPMISSTKVFTSTTSSQPVIRANKNSPAQVLPKQPVSKPQEPPHFVKKVPEPPKTFTKLVQPFSGIEDEHTLGSDSQDSIPLERIPGENDSIPDVHYPVKNIMYEKESEYRPAKEGSTFHYNIPEEKSFPSPYSPLASLQDFTSRPSPLKPSLIETYPNTSSPTKLTPLDSYSQTGSPKGFISLDSYPQARKKRNLYGNTPMEHEMASRPMPLPSEHYPGEIRFPQEPYSCPQSPSVYPPRTSPQQPRDPGSPPRLYSQYPDAYAPPRSPEYYHNQQQPPPQQPYYPPEEGLLRTNYQPNYAMPPEHGVPYPYLANPIQQPNGGFMIDTLLRARNPETLEDELTGVTDIVSYITQE